MQNTLRLAEIVSGTATIAMLADCTSAARPTLAQMQLVVWGTASGLDHFYHLQRSHRPALPITASIDRASHGHITVTLPAEFTGQELIVTTRGALAAGLSYRYRERRSG